MTAGVKKIYVFYWLLAGLGGNDFDKPRCAPGVCFRDNGCVVTDNGVECGPCPDGYTGDGFSCDDVDEVCMCA